MKGTVLILDDDIYIRKIVSSLLGSDGYEVVEARTGRSALSELQKQKFDLIIVDYRLPDCDGLSWIGQLRTRGCKTPIMFLSGIFCDNVMATRLRNLFDVHLILKKPIEPLEFVRLVNVQLQQNGVEIVDAPDEASTDESTTSDCLEPNSAVGSSNNDSNHDESVDPHCIYDNLMESDSEEGDEFQDLDFWFPIDDAPDEPLTLEELVAKDLDNRIASVDSVEPSIEINSEVASALELLKWEYLKELPAMLRELANDLELAVSNNDASAVENAILKAHTLKGSSGSFSLYGVSELASTIESTLDNRIPPSPLLSKLEGIIAAQTPSALS